MRKISTAWRYIAAMEPARVVALWRAVLVLVGLVAAWYGRILPPEIEVQGVAAIGAFYALVDLITTEATRSRVVPVSKLPVKWVEEVEAQDGPLADSPASLIRQ